MNILVIEDEPVVARTVERGLKVDGHLVMIARTGEEGLSLLESDPVDLVLLDIMLPGDDGQRVLAAIRRLGNDVPVIMLTARDDLDSKLTALDGGADEYLTKPYALAELLARIRALTRRASQRQSAFSEFGDLRIDLVSHRVWRGGQPIGLAPREFALLEFFARNRGRLLSRQEILAAIWEDDVEGDSRVVDVYVRYLRAKLDREGEASLFTTVRGGGYRFDPPSTTD